MKTICFEGGEGSGKGTAIKALISHLESQGYKVIKTREPGGTPISESVREVIVDEKHTAMSGLTEALLFAACRTQLLKEVIRPAIERDDADFMIIDRYVYSSYVYQGMARGVGYDKVRAINEIATDGWHPDVVIFLDIDPQKGLDRIAANNRETNRLDKESIAFHNKVRAGYLSIADEFGFKVINADQNPEDVVKDIISVI